MLLLGHAASADYVPAFPMNVLNPVVVRTMGPNINRMTVRNVAVDVQCHLDAAGPKPFLDNLRMRRKRLPDACPVGYNADCPSSTSSPSIGREWQ